MRQYISRIFILLLTSLNTLSICGADTPNSKQARQMFEKTYQMVFGKQGCSLHYDVNLIGLYKTNGNIWYKG